MPRLRRCDRWPRVGVDVCRSPRSASPFDLEVTSAERRSVEIRSALPRVERRLEVLDAGTSPGPSRATSSTVGPERRIVDRQLVALDEHELGLRRAFGAKPRRAIWSAWCDSPTTGVVLVDLLEPTIALPTEREHDDEGEPAEDRGLPVPARSSGPSGPATFLGRCVCVAPASTAVASPAPGRARPG